VLDIRETVSTTGADFAPGIAESGWNPHCVLAGSPEQAKVTGLANAADPLTDRL